MISKGRILAITDAITGGLLNGKDEGGEEEANKALKFLLTNLTLQTAFLESVGRGAEYDGWLKRIKVKYPSIQTEISERIFVIEEI